MEGLFVAAFAAVFVSWLFMLDRKTPEQARHAAWMKLDGVLADEETSLIGRTAALYAKEGVNDEYLEHRLASVRQERRELKGRYAA